MVTLSQHGKKKLMARVRHNTIVTGTKRSKTVPIRKGKYRSSPHYFTYSEGKSSVNRKTGRR